jgi:uncharacterized protein
MNYKEVNTELENLNLDRSISQLHGEIAAWLCIHQQESTQWIEDLLPGCSMSSTLEILYDSTSAELKSDDFNLELLLPVDEEPLEIRAQALAEWTQGFLDGLGHVKDDCLKNPEIEATIVDISHISELDYETLEEDNDSETAFVEIEEFVKVAVLFIYTEIRGPQDRDDQDGASGNETIH